MICSSLIYTNEHNCKKFLILCAYFCPTTRIRDRYSLAELNKRDVLGNSPLSISSKENVRFRCFSSNYEYLNKIILDFSLYDLPANCHTVIAASYKETKSHVYSYFSLFNVEIFSPKSKSYKFGSAATTADLINVYWRYYESGTQNSKQLIKSDLRGEILVLKLF